MERKRGVRLLVTIVERRQGQNMAKLYSENGVDWHYHSIGFGTASSELLDVLGFGTSERDILFSLAEGEKVRRLLYDLNNDLHGRVSSKGIVFSAALTGINNLVASMLMQETVVIEEGEIPVQDKSNNSLILIAVNQGHTDKVMETAKKAGARGGTIIKGRWSGSEQSEKFFGITLQTEKEIIVMLVTNQTRNRIMESVNKEHGLHSEAGAMICSLAVDQMVRLS